MGLPPTRGRRAGVARAWGPASTVVAGLSLFVFLTVSAQVPPATVFQSFDQAQPIFDALGERPPSPEKWAAWIAESDRTTRLRLRKGDEMSVVNLLLFGTSFTTEPRITPRELDRAQANAAVVRRLDDFERALAREDANERLRFARGIVGSDRSIRARLVSMLDAAITEGNTHEALVREAHALGDSRLEFAERSRLYRSRGLSSDTSIRVQFAVEDALGQIKEREPRPYRMRHVGVIGPGLDFVDKQEGYDFYPPQTLQPFAMIDTLVRLGLAEPDALTVTTLDLSARINEHLEQARTRARRGEPYMVHIPLDGEVSWTPEFLTYWRRFGETIGSPVLSVAPASVGSLKLRAVGVRPAVVQQISVRDLNITAQQLSLDGSGRFDIIIGTNIFVYYDRLQQGLAMANVSSMLRPGGYLLSNNALVEIPSVGLRAVGYSKTMYSNREEDGDLIIWYQKAQ